MIGNQIIKDEERRIEAVEEGSVKTGATTEVGDALQLLHEQLGGFIYCERP